MSLGVTQFPYNGEDVVSVQVKSMEFSELNRVVQVIAASMEDVLFVTIVES